MKRDEALNYMIECLQSEKHQDYVDVAIPGFLAHKIIAYQSMREDLLTVRKSTELLLDTELDPIIKASLWYSIIALYGRCFTDAGESKYPKLEVSGVFSGTNELAETHNLLMDLRHKFVAHRGESTNEVSMSFMRVHFTLDGKEIVVRQLRQNRPDEGLLKNILTITEHLIPQIVKKYEKAAIKISRSMFKNFTPEELIKMRIP